jgi:hypothetical protein
MTDLEFISSISNTFIDEINKFISTFTTTIKNQFEEVDKKVIAQNTEINKLRDELNSKKFDEKNYNTVSVIKNQDKQIYELNNTIKTLENRVKFLESKTIKESSNTNIKTNNTTLEIIEETTSDDLVELPSPPSPPPVLPMSPVSSSTPSIIEKSRVIEEPKIEETISITPIESITTAKKTVAKKNTKKVKEEVIEEVKEVKEVIEEISEKPKRKIAIKKNNKNDVKGNDESIQEVKVIEKVEEPETKIETKVEPKVETNLEDNTKLESKIIEDKNIDIIPVVEIESKSKIDKTTKVDKKETKETKEKKDTKTKKDKEVKKEIKIEEKVIDVNYPDTIPDLDSVNILEFDNIDYYLDEKTNNVFQITEDEDIGIFIGVYDKENKKIHKMNK